MTNANTKDSWTITDRVGGRSVVTYTLIGEGGRTATVRCERNGMNRDAGRVVVTFDKPTIGHEMHARAEAARLYAQICDTIGDLANEDPYDADPTLLGTTVEVHGGGALTAVACYFDDESCETLIDTDFE